MGTKVRILADVKLDGVDYKPNQVVEFPAPVAKALAEAGQVDPHKDAVAYCIKTLGAEVVVHAEPAAEVVVPTDPLATPEPAPADPQ